MVTAKSTNYLLDSKCIWPLTYFVSNLVTFAALETLMTSREFLLHGKVTQELVRNWAPSSEVLLATFVATDSKPALLRVKHYGDSDVRTVS